MASRWFRVGVSGAKICVATRPIRSGIRKRSKERIARVRHRYLDSAIDGEARFTSLQAFDAIIALSAFISTSHVNHQVLRRIDSSRFEHREISLGELCASSDRDPISTDFSHMHCPPR